MTKAASLYEYLDDIASQGFEVTLKCCYTDLKIEVKNMGNKFSTTIFNYHGEQELMIKKIKSLVKLMKLLIEEADNV